MRRVITLICAAILLAPAAFADEKPSAEEAAKIKATLEAWGCSGGVYEKESEGTGVYEVDDAKCKDGNQFDVKLDEKFTVRSMTRD